MPTVVPMSWRAVLDRARVLVEDGSIAVRVGDMLIASDGTPTASACIPPWTMFPVIVPTGAEMIGQAIVNLINGGFRIEPVEGT